MRPSRASARSRGASRRRSIDPPALGTRVAWIARDGARWHVDLTSPSGDLALSAARVVVAAPAYAAADVLRGIDGEIAAALEGIAYAPIVVAPVGIEAGRAREPIEGFGFLVPREESMGLLGCLFMSQLFRGRAPAGHELLHCMLGGVRWPEAVHLPDAAIQARLSEDLSRTLGIADPPAALGFVRWPRAVPQPGRDHRARMRWLLRPARPDARARARGILRRGRLRVGLAGVGTRCGISHTRGGSVRVKHELCDRLHPGRVGVRAVDAQEFLTAEPAPLIARADPDLLDRLEAIGDERRAEDREPPDARGRELGQHEVGVGPDPRRTPEPRLERGRGARRVEAERGDERGGRGEALRAVAVAVRRARRADSSRCWRGSVRRFGPRRGSAARAGRDRRTGRDRGGTRRARARRRRARRG